MPQQQAEIHLHLQDTQWPYDGITHTREVVRGIVFDEAGQFYFLRVEREDEFGTGTFIETAGGGVEKGENLPSALLRELQEELGAVVEIVDKIGVVEDDYHLIHRHNVTHYFLCKVIGFGTPNLTPEEQKRFRLFPQRLTYDQAITAYESASNSRLGRLLAARELPMLRQAKAMLDRI